MSRFDAAVVGLGGMGSAVAAHLSMRGARICAFEQYRRGHDLGASSGHSRIIRKAYFEDAAYVPLLHRSYELWKELAARTSLAIWDLVGVLVVAGAKSFTIERAMRSAYLHDVEIEELNAAQIVKRYPTLKLRENERGIFEPHAGALFPENALESHLRVAEEHGAQLRFETAVSSVESLPAGVRLMISDGDSIDVDRVAVCAGPWLSQFIDVGIPIQIQRNVQLWFRPRTQAYAKERFPAFLLEREGLPGPLYGFPDFGAGVKAALHGWGAYVTPAGLDREIHAQDIAAVKDPMDSWMPGAAAAFAFGKACMYALTPDRNFILDALRPDRRVVIAGGFSGHGFKFCPVVGEIVADLLLEGATRHEIGFLSIRERGL